MRYLATIGFCLTTFMGLLIADNTEGYRLWAIILLVSPFAWFWVVGNRNQWRSAEMLIFLVMGVIGAFASCFWGMLGEFGYLPREIPDNQLQLYTYRALFLLPFWGSAGVAVMKLGGTLMVQLEPGTYNREYLDSLKGKTGHWFWGLVGLGWLIYQFTWLHRVL